MNGDKFALLRHYFGHSSFRPGQEQLIDALLNGQDVLGVMPTGAGKSICYQLPAMMLPGITLVISPLISLMKDQVAALHQAGIPSAFINSSLSAEQYREVLSDAADGAYKLIYVAPERLNAPGFLSLIGQTEISLVAVDEAHCVSQWGQDFRPSYLHIAEFIRSLPNRPVVGAFTATATAQVKADMEKLLELEHPLRITTGFDRPNLFFEVVSTRKKGDYLLDFLSQRPGQSGIIYCATRKNVEKVCDDLRAAGIPSTRYHAGLSDRERKANQEDFVCDRSRVMVATNAFGMGIDKSNVSFVVHYNMPKNIENYYQEAGRAGRDGENAHCLLLFSAADIVTARYMINHSPENEALSPAEREEVHRLELLRLDAMVEYCKTPGCLRGHLLRYFGENAPEHCGGCGNCTAELIQRDITIQAQKILSAVARVEKKFPASLGQTLIVGMLRGSRAERIYQLGLQLFPTYGIMRDENRRAINAYVEHLLREGYLSLEGEEYPVLRLTERAKGVLFAGETVLFSERQTPASPTKGRKAPGNDDLLDLLKAVRLRLARQEDVPAYIIFSNATLADMAARQPTTMDELRNVTGVGSVKCARYGTEFLTAIREYLHQ